MSSARDPRPAGLAITDFGDIWADVAKPLTRMLRARGVDAHDAEEIAQETAVRALAGRVAYTSADDLLRWASVVGWRIAIDRRRRANRISDEAVPDRAASVDVATTVEHRLLLAAVAERLPALSARDRAAILSPAPPARDRSEAVRLAVARHRARHKLRGLLEGLVALGGWLWARRRPAGPRRAAMIAETAAAGVAVTAAVLLVISIGPGRVTDQGVAPHRSPDGARTVPAAVARTESPSPQPGTVVPRPAGRPSAEPAEPAEPAGIGVVIPTPRGGDAGAGLRPKGDDDSLACVSIPPFRRTCFDMPLRPYAPGSLTSGARTGIPHPGRS